MNVEKNGILKAINSYGQEVKEYLISDNIIEKINIIAESALKNAPENISPEDVKKSDNIIFPDIHGQLDLFIQNLYIANVIDKNAQVKDGMNSALRTGLDDTTSINKTIVQLGDTIDYGEYEVETLIFLRGLKNAAAKKGIDINLIVGNHEFKLINSVPETADKKVMRDIIINDVLNNRLKASFANNQLNMLCVHAGLQKKNLLKVLIDMSKEEEFKVKLEPVRAELIEALEKLNQKQDKVLFKDSKTLNKLSEQVSTERIYTKFVYGRGLELTDISNFINDKFKEVVKEIKDKNIIIDVNHKFGYMFVDKSSILFSRRKAKNTHHSERGINDSKEFLTDKSMKKYLVKPLQLVGHSTTSNPKVKGYGLEGGIKQNRATILIDAGLPIKDGSNQAFVAINSNKGTSYAIEIIDKEKQIGFEGLDENKNPINLDKKIDRIRTREL